MPHAASHLAVGGSRFEKGPARIASWVITVWEPLALLGVLVLGVGLRSELLGIRPLWFDEAYSLEIARKSLWGMLAFLRAHDAHPIGYYAFLSVWIRWFGTGLAEMRSSSLLFGMAAVLLTWRVGRQLCSPPIGIVAAALVAVNPYQIIAANEIRMYPLLECLVLASTWILWRASASPARAGWWVGYGVSAVLMAYTSYYSFLLLPAQAMWVFLSHPPRQAIRNLGIAGATALALYVPWIPYVLTLPDRVPLPWRQPISLDYLAALIASQTFGGYVSHVGTYQTVGGSNAAYHPLLLFPFLALMGAGIFALDRINRPVRTLFGLSWLVPLVLIVLASLALGRMAAFPRHLIFLHPFAAFVIAAGIVHLRDAVIASPRALVPLLGLLLALTFAYPAVDEAQGNPEYQYFRYDLAAKFVKTLYKPGDAVLFFPAAIALPFRYYFEPPGKQIFVEVDPHRWSKTGVHPAVRRATDFLETHKVKRVWLIYSYAWPPGSLEDLEGALKQKDFDQSPVEDFHEVWVTLFVRARTP